MYPRELPLGSQSHSRTSSLCVRARVLFVYKPYVLNRYSRIPVAQSQEYEYRRGGGSD